MLQRLGRFQRFQRYDCFWSLWFATAGATLDIYARTGQYTMALRALMQKYGPAAAISYSSVTLTFFSTIYATLTFGYDPSPLILEIVSHAAMAGIAKDLWGSIGKNPELKKVVMEALRADVERAKAAESA